MLMAHRRPLAFEEPVVHEEASTYRVDATI